MEKKYPILPNDEQVAQWFTENINKDCSPSSAIYKFRLWLQSWPPAEAERGKEDDVIGFAEWAAKLAYFDEEYRLWNFLEEGKMINGQFRFTTKEFFELYKKDESAREKEVDNG